jgi:hypothetical protein
MRETRLSGSEGGGARTPSPYPYPRQRDIRRDADGCDRELDGFRAAPCFHRDGFGWSAV